MQRRSVTLPDQHRNRKPPHTEKYPPSTSHLGVVLFRRLAIARILQKFYGIVIGSERARLQPIRRGSLLKSRIITLLAAAAIYSTGDIAIAAESLVAASSSNAPSCWFKRDSSLESHYMGLRLCSLEQALDSSQHDADLHAQPAQSH